MILSWPDAPVSRLKQCTMGWPRHHAQHGAHGLQIKLDCGQSGSIVFFWPGFTEAHPRKVSGRAEPGQDHLRLTLIMIILSLAS